MVLIGVLVALFVDSWREDIEFETLVEATENNVTEEIQSNRDRLMVYRDDFRLRQERLAIWGSDLDTNLGILYQLNGFPGIPSTFMNRSSWSMAINSQITQHFDHEFYDSAFELYANGEAMEDRLNIVLRVFINVQGYDAEYTTALFEVLKFYFDDIINNIENLMDDHDRFLAEFEFET